LVEEKVEALRKPLEIQNARNDRKKLQFGFASTIEKMNTALEKGPPSDSRFPERDNEWLEVREKLLNLQFDTLSFDFGNFEILKFWNFEIWNFGVLEFWNFRLLRF
jgi:hypothetical protein